MVTVDTPMPNAVNYSGKGYYGGPMSSFIYLGHRNKQGFKKKLELKEISFRTLPAKQLLELSPGWRGWIASQCILPLHPADRSRVQAS